jgi:S1-C subfamily serine protease
MTADEALERLRAREAQQATAAATRPDANLSVKTDAHGPDLSARVQTLDTLLYESFRGTIGSSYLPAETQEWLNTAASKATVAASKLANVEASAQIIISSVTSDDGGIVIQGHLFPVSQRATLSRAGRVQLLPVRDAYDAADRKLSSLNAQISALLAKRGSAVFDMAATPSTDTDRITRDRAIIDEVDNQTSNLRSLLPDAQRKLAEAQTALDHTRQNVMQNQNAGMQVWGPITVNTQDESYLNKLPGNIITMRVRVGSVDVNVTRTPDCAGWDFSSDAANEGQTHMPIASDPTGPGAVASEVESTITLTCDDVSSYPTSRPSLSRSPVASAQPTMMNGAMPNARPLGREPRPIPARGFVSNPHDDKAMSAAVGFVVVGFQAVLSDGTVRQRALVTGSCFTVSPTGYLLTNRHVVELTDTLDDPSIHEDIRARFGATIQPRTWVFFGTNQYDAQIIFKSTKFDLAILKVARREQVCFRLANRPAESRGVDVFAAGFPGLGSEALSDKELQNDIDADNALSASFDIKSQFKPRDFAYTLTKGSVGRIFRDADNECWIQHEAVIRHGNSGGPLLNESGIVLGINTLAQHDNEGDAQTNLSEEISQLRRELDRYTPGLVWVSP